jgi:hypothetical protein
MNSSVETKKAQGNSPFSKKGIPYVELKGMYVFPFNIQYLKFNIIFPRSAVVF